jgi:hypothetical protein
MYISVQNGLTIHQDSVSAFCEFHSKVTVVSYYTKWQVVEQIAPKHSEQGCLASQQKLLHISLPFETLLLSNPTDSVLILNSDWPSPVTWADATPAALLALQKSLALNHRKDFFAAAAAAAEQQIDLLDGL